MNLGLFIWTLQDAIGLILLTLLVVAFVGATLWDKFRGYNK